MRRPRVVWSPVETEYLKRHKNDNKDQLCIALAKSRSAVDKKLRELGLTGGKAKPAIAKGRQSRVGKREDLGIFVRSGWEANMMRLFQSGECGFKFLAYEPHIFSFTEWEKPRGQALSYTPDFQVEDITSREKYWVEVKGNWLRPHDKTKLRRFKKHYPADFSKLLAVVSSKRTKTAEFFLSLGVPEEHVVEYNVLKKEFRSKIPHWED